MIHHHHPSPPPSIHKGKNEPIVEYYLISKMINIVTACELSLLPSKYGIPNTPPMQAGLYTRGPLYPYLIYGVDHGGIYGAAQRGEID